MIEEKPLIGVLKNKLKPSHKLKRAIELNVDLIIFSHQYIDWEQKRVTGLLLVDNQFIKRTLAFPDAVFLKKYTTTNTLSKKIEKTIGEGKVFNTITRFDKWKTYYTLQKSRVISHFPDTYKYHSRTVLDLLNKYKKLIIKSRKGCLGKKVYTIAKSSDDMFYFYYHINSPELSTSNAQELIDKLETITSGKEKYIAQAFIEFDRTDNQLYDIRIYVQKDGTGIWKVTGGFCRLSGPKFYKTNFSSKLITIEELIKENNQLTQKNLFYMKTLALQTANDLEKGYGHLGDICIDFGLGKNGKVWIIEINSKAGKNMVTKFGDETFIRNVYLRPIEYARYLALNLPSKSNHETKQ